MHSDDLNRLKTWFLSQKRDLPWRNHEEGSPNPYAVWVSEVMLQQTQVSVVIPYFLRWMERFPTVVSLAEASLETVLKEWEGLGYYSRARNLREGARYIVQYHQGILPDTAESLEKVKGLGPYTIQAILSFAFHKKAAAVDGNVMRVLARYYSIEENIQEGKVQKKIRALAEDLLPDTDPWIIAEALIELGATVCTRKAKCMECPLQSHCMAFGTEKAERLPIKKSNSQVTPLFRLVPVLFCKDLALVRREERKMVMGDLFQFPYFETAAMIKDLREQKAIISKRLKTDFSLKATWKLALREVKHSFTRYRACLFPHVYHTDHPISIHGYQWLPLEELKALPFSSGHRQIVNMLGC